MQVEWWGFNEPHYEVVWDTQPLPYNLFGLFVLTVTQAGGTQKRQMRALTPGAISTTKIYKNSLISFGSARLGLV